jgi:ubiquitin-activating enzyme E1
MHLAGLSFLLTELIPFLFHSRYVLGHEAMKKMGTSNILIVGLKGLGIEIGKRLVPTLLSTLTTRIPGRPWSLAE